MNRHLYDDWLEEPYAEQEESPCENCSVSTTCKTARDGNPADCRDREHYKKIEMCSVRDKCPHFNLACECSGELDTCENSDFREVLKAEAETKKP